MVGRLGEEMGRRKGKIGWKMKTEREMGRIGVWTE
jgi:hypothetical protein